MSSSNQRYCFIKIVLGFIILTNVALFAWGQAYISGRYIPKDIFVPALAMFFSWGTIALLARLHHVWLMRLWAFVIALFCAINIVLFKYYWELGIHLSIYDIGAMMQTNVHEAVSYISDFMISPWSVAAFILTLILVIFGAEIIWRKYRVILSKGFFRKNNCKYILNRGGHIENTRHG